MSENTAKYRRIADILRERIHRRQYKAGETIPSYPELCAMFAVSEMRGKKFARAAPMSALAALSVCSA